MSDDLLFTAYTPAGVFWKADAAKQGLKGPPAGLRDAILIPTKDGYVWRGIAEGGGVVSVPAEAAAERKTDGN